MIKSEEQLKIGYLLEYVKLSNYDRYYDPNNVKLKSDLRIVTIISELQKLLTEQLRQDYSGRENEMGFALNEVYHSRTKEVRKAIKLEQDNTKKPRERKINTCKRCGWIWFPIKKISYECPKCQSPRWQVAKDKKGE